MEMDHTHVVMQLLFENTQFASIANSIATLDINVTKNSLSLPIRSEIFFELFPFHVVFKRNLEIVSIGESLKQTMKHVEHESLTDVFNLVRPLMNCNWQNVILNWIKLNRSTRKNATDRIIIQDEYSAKDASWIRDYLVKIKILTGWKKVLFNFLKSPVFLNHPIFFKYFSFEIL